MEFQIFFWTGKVIWYAVCGSMVLSVVAVCVFAPFAAYRAVEKALWHWKLSAELAKYGFSEADIRFAISLPGGLPCEYEKFIEAVKRVKRRGDSVKKTFSA